ncbi:alpha/beta fold hydrolase [Geminocystis sp. GBBB08]|uniref:YheT family hydrolase n=1 Tax=Geminocystis sp. GBBB08 TaxID=2604140 RepID=UPI0027E3A71A|nr:alpha/beta fold hydrolase [Geminocystis sp. GBBB08]MBL1210113.1 esterase [Geminocystis sp. GBBB08]
MLTQGFFEPPFFLKNGLLMTLNSAFNYSKNWQKKVDLYPLNYQSVIFNGYQNTPIYAQVAIPKNAKSTIIATYGITGDLTNQWFLQVLAHKAFHQNHAIILFDWRSHGKTAELSPALTSDGLYEGKDFVLIATQAKKMGCPTPFCFMGYSLGGKLALWGLNESRFINENKNYSDLKESDIKGCAVVCPSLDAKKSLLYLMNHPIYKYVEKAITKNLKKLALSLYEYHPQQFDLEVINNINSIWNFDQELVIKKLNFKTVEEYYHATSPLNFLPDLNKPTFILYAEDDPLFCPSIVPNLINIAKANSQINLFLTIYGGHVGYISNKYCQQYWQDQDQWYSWNRILDWWNLLIG